MDLKEWFNYGLPTALLVTLILALWRMIIWAKEAIVVPVVEAHLKTVRAFSDELPKQTVQLEEIKTSVAELTGQSATLKEIERKVAEAVAKTEAHSKWSNEAIKTICKLKESDR